MFIKLYLLGQCNINNVKIDNRGRYCKLYYIELIRGKQVVFLYGGKHFGV